jgi:3-hydroxybutyryl-CoA dehydratase
VVEKEKNRFKVEVRCLVDERVVAEGWVKILAW